VQARFAAPLAPAHDASMNAKQQTFKERIIHNNNWCYCFRRLNARSDRLQTAAAVKDIFRKTSPCLLWPGLRD